MHVTIKLSDQDNDFLSPFFLKQVASLPRLALDSLKAAFRNDTFLGFFFAVMLAALTTGFIRWVMKPF
jgi:hypothetical protein